MSQQTSPYLPSEIIINILSRLPVRTIITCKLVCKSWLPLVETQEFAKTHLSKSVPGLVAYQYDHDITTFEFEDGLDLAFHELHYKPVTKFNRRAFISLPHATIGIKGSANGLLLLREINTQPNALYICNPVTREYIELQNEGFVYSYPAMVTYGFGVSKMTSKHKVVRVYHECIRDPQTHALLSIPKSVCKVYTLGTGCWRSIAPVAALEYNCRSIGALVNGNLHWLVADLKGSYLISRLDLETELFYTFSPQVPLQRSGGLLGSLVDLGGRLCLCDNTSDDEIVIWLMKKYGDDKSWTKEFVISKIPDLAGESYEVIYPIKVFEDGDILMAWQELYLFYYNKTRLVPRIDVCGLQNHDVASMLHTSSFLSLKNFPGENVRSF